MAKKYAKGRHAVAECQRSGQKMRYRDLVEDGHIPGLLVHPDWYEPQHPQEIPVTVDDPIALRRPAPEISVPSNYGFAEKFLGSSSSPAIFDDFERTGAADTFGGGWIQCGLQYLGDYHDMPVIEDGIATSYTDISRDNLGFGIAYHPLNLGVDHYIEGVVTNVFVDQEYGGQDDFTSFNAYVWLRASSNGIAGPEMNSGFYLYLSQFPEDNIYEPGVGVSLSRWDSPSSYSNLEYINLGASSTIADGTTLRMEAVDDVITCYYNGDIIFTNTVTQYLTATNVGFGFENYDEGDAGTITGGFESVRAGRFYKQNETLGIALTGGETKAVLDSAIALPSWAEWVRIALDGGGYHYTRLADFGHGQSPTFVLRLTTAFPSGSAAAAGNVVTLLSSKDANA